MYVYRRCAWDGMMGAGLGGGDVYSTVRKLETVWMGRDKKMGVGGVEMGGGDGDEFLCQTYLRSV